MSPEGEETRNHIGGKEKRGNTTNEGDRGTVKVSRRSLSCWAEAVKTSQWPLQL